MIDAFFRADGSQPHDGYIPAGRAELYYREVGRGRAIVVLHGGPDFGHSYLLPAMDRLADGYRLIYYDQRGRGQSAEHVEPGAVSLGSEIDDLDRVRAYFGLEMVALLGHSWGGLLAMEYALRHPERVSHLILMNPPPASHDDMALFREKRRKQSPDDVAALKELAATEEYAAGDPETVMAYYRVHYRGALKRQDLLDRVLHGLRPSLATPEAILKGRAIEDRLVSETWARSDYDLLPVLERLRLPALVVQGEHDFIPGVCTAKIVRAIPGARHVYLSESGHFSYLECPEAVRTAIDRFFQDT
jgi:proline iminopeptidase